jgi:DNA (cytosine-5)-methyltransferase 1
VHGYAAGDGLREAAQPPEQEGAQCVGEFAGSGDDSDAGETNGFWGAADWLYCRDGKWRATQSTDERLADGIANSLGYCRIRDRYSLNPLVEKAENRVGRLKGFGNAIVAPQAQAFIAAYMEI